MSSSQIARAKNRAALRPQEAPEDTPCAAHRRHAVSQKLRQRIEEIFGWAKTTGGFRKSCYRSVERTHAQGQYVVAAWNLVRMARLMVTAPPKLARA